MNVPNRQRPTTSSRRQKSLVYSDVTLGWALERAWRFGHHVVEVLTVVLHESLTIFGGMRWTFSPAVMPCTHLVEASNSYFVRCRSAAELPFREARRMRSWRRNRPSLAADGCHSVPYSVWGRSRCTASMVQARQLDETREIIISGHAQTDDVSVTSELAVWSAAGEVEGTVEGTGHQESAARERGFRAWSPSSSPPSQGGPLSDPQPPQHLRFPSHSSQRLKHSPARLQTPFSALPASFAPQFARLRLRRAALKSGVGSPNTVPRRHPPATDSVPRAYCVLSPTSFAQPPLALSHTPPN